MSKEKPTEIRRTPHLKGPVLALITKDTILLQAEPEDAPRGCLDLIRHHNAMLALAVRERLAQIKPERFEFPNASDDPEEAPFVYEGRLLFDGLKAEPWDSWREESVWGAALLEDGGVAFWERHHDEDGADTGRVFSERIGAKVLSGEETLLADIHPLPWSLICRFLGREVV